MKKGLFLISIIAVFWLVSCQPNVTQISTISVKINHDNQTETVKVEQGFTVRQTLALANISLGTLDTVEPGADGLVRPDEIIKVVRVTENFVIEETTLAFESQTVKNESLPVGQTLLIQAGINGIQSNTYRAVSEDGVEKSRTLVKTEITQPAQPEIIMIGIQSPFKSVVIQGTLVYISSANAWVMEGNTGSRKEVVNTGDLDGRIFTLSPDHQWLLFSRSASKNETETVNSLWVVNITDANPIPISLNIKNVVNYAEWVPGKELTIAYSTVEWRSTPPGWQANDDLQILNFNETGKKLSSSTIIDTNHEGISSWWGTSYAFSPDASEIAYTRPDSIGLVDSKTHQLSPLLDFTAYDTQSDWAWVPEICWSSDHSILFSVLPADHSSATGTSFNVSAYVLSTNTLINLQENTGMFSFPVISPNYSQDQYWVAYLSATLPDQSDTSAYDLHIMDRDGSNMKKLYPGEGIQGLKPQQVVWSPDINNSNPEIAFIAQGNLMFVDPITGAVQQSTGDGSISKIDWK